MKKTFKYLFIAALATFVGCSNDTDNLEKDIAAVKDRVEKLEAQMNVANENIKNLQKLMNDGITISTVEHDTTKGVYTLTLSDGQVLNLAERIENQEVKLQVGINKDGMWQVSYDDGKTFEVIKTNGKPTLAKGENGATPLFRISKDSYWEVSVNGGKSFEKVLDENGKPVKVAQADENDKFFTSIVAKEDALDIVLKDGTALSIPIVKDFFCYFDVQYKGIQTIEEGESVIFKVHLKGANQIMVNAPQGWVAKLGEATNNVAELTLTAPLSTATTRAIADNSKDVTILATAGIFAQIAKIQVELGKKETPVEPVDPVLPIIDFITPITSATHIITLFNSDPTKVTDQEGDFWFHRTNGKDEEAMNKNGSIELVQEMIDGKEVTAAKFDCKIPNSFFKLALGYAKKEANCDIKKTYKVTFQLKGTADKKFLTTLRTAGSDSSFGVYNGGNEPTTTMKTATIASDNDGNTWEEVVAIFDFSYKAEKVGGIKDDTNPLQKAEERDGKSLDFRFYPQEKNTVFYIANIKFEEFIPENN